VRSALSLADDRGLASIALPAISTGIFGYPIELAVLTILTAVLGYLDEHSDSSLRDIRMCDMNKAALALFAEEVARLAGGASPASPKQA